MGVNNEEAGEDYQGAEHLSAPSGRLVALGSHRRGPGSEPSRGEVGPFGALRQQSLEAIFPPIADYAFLSDCENSCLVAPTGAVEWLCIPKPHDPSVFGTLLDRAAGSFRLAPVDSAVPAHRQYVPGTMVLATTWQTRSGWLVVQRLSRRRALVPHRRALGPPPAHARRLRRQARPRANRDLPARQRRHPAQLRAVL